MADMRVIKAIAELKEQGVTLDVVLDAIADYADSRADWYRVSFRVREAALEVKQIQQTTKPA